MIYRLSIAVYPGASYGPSGHYCSYLVGYLLCLLDTQLDAQAHDPLAAKQDNGLCIVSTQTGLSMCKNPYTFSSHQRQADLICKQ